MSSSSIFSELYFDKAVDPMDCDISFRSKKKFSSVVLGGSLFILVKVVRASIRSRFSGEILDSRISAGSFGVLNNSSINDSKMCLGFWVSVEYIVLKVMALDIVVVRYARGAIL